MKKLKLVLQGIMLLTLLIFSVTAKLAALASLRANAFSLNGTWESALGNGAEQAWTPQGQQSLTWNTVTVPCNNLDTTGTNVGTIQYAWARRNFDLTAQQAQQLAILYWDYVPLGASVYINGQFVGHNEPVGPYQVIIPPGILQAGANQIVMKVTGYAGVAKSVSGKPLIPSGQVIAWGDARQPSIRHDIWIDFADTAYMKWILAIPDLAGSKVTIRVTPDALNTATNLSLDVTVKTWPGGQTFSSASGSAANLVPDPNPLGGTHSYLNVPMTGFQAWTHHTPGNLYTAEVKLKQGAQVLDTATIRFGMREIKNQNGDYWMNGKRLWLRGVTATGHYVVQPTYQEIQHNYVNNYQAGNVNTIRYHCSPPGNVYADVCDECGMMMLPEFPVTYNGQNFNFTPAEYATYHQNAITDAAGWVTRLWNHPSNIMWVLSNESMYDNAWENGLFRDFVQTLDPTRPTMRSGGSGGTVDCYDVHSLGPALPEGSEIPGAAAWMKTAGTTRTCGNTEYMNYGFRDWIWTGDTDDNHKHLAYAQINSEITEAMRRSRLDLILPFGWWGRDTDDSTGYYHFLSPILASLDLYDPSYVTGQQVTTNLYLINDSWAGTDLLIDLILTNSDPKFTHDAAVFNTPVAKWSYNYNLPADSVTPVPVTWQTPLVPGSYWLTARITGSGITGNPVLSQRFLHVIEPAVISAALNQKNFVVLGSDAQASAFFNAKGLTTSTNTSNLDPNNDMVIIWNFANLTAAEKQSAAALCSFAHAGGHVVVLAASSWDWTALCNAQISTRSSSRAFLYAGAQHPMFNGIQPEFFTRWNSVKRRGLVANNDLENLSSGANKIMWIYDKAYTAVAEIPAAAGSGKILFSQLDLRNRLDPAAPEYDPVAERVLVNILAMLDPGQVSNQPPTANAGLDQTVTDTDMNGSEQITLDGSGSSDTDGSITDYTWYDGLVQISTEVKPTVNLSTGTHFITLKVTDNDSAAASDTVIIGVNIPGNNPPVANIQSVSTNMNTPVAVILTGSDPDNDPVTYTVVSVPAHGTLSGTAPNLTYTPAANYQGQDSFTFVVNDGIVSSSQATVTITVNGAPGPDPDVLPDNTSVPTKTELNCYNNVINPARGDEATIKIEIDELTLATVAIYDHKGKEIKKLMDEQKQPGFYTLKWSGRDESGNTVGSGIYLVHMKSETYSTTKKIAIVK